jgi:hypothetical protein
MGHVAGLLKVDLEFSFEEALCNPKLASSKRVLAGLCIGMDEEDAFAAVDELHAAVTAAVGTGSAGAERLMEVLSNRACDDFQRALYYALAGRGIDNMVTSLRWLREVLRVRRRASSWARLSDVPVVREPNPYVSDRPDGPVPAFDQDVQLGPSWDQASPQR